MSTEPLNGQAHLYLAATNDWTRGDRLAATLEFLSRDERRRYERFRVTAPARAFATGRALARQTLSLYAGVAPGDWRLDPDEHGRPRITGPPGGPVLEFNLSHNDDLVACLMTGGVACGVDVESLARRVDARRIAEHSFGEEETRDLRARDGADRRRRFFAYWTLKEAYLKARGRGIEMRMDSVVFSLVKEGRITVGFPPRVDERPERWQFSLYRTETDELVAVALRRESGRDLDIRAFQSSPGEPQAAAATLRLERVTRPAVEVEA